MLKLVLVPGWAIAGRRRTYAELLLVAGGHVFHLYITLCFTSYFTYYFTVLVNKPAYLAAAMYWSTTGKGQS